MSDIEFMSAHGPYVPFEKPLAVPTSDVFDSPTDFICFNRDWRAAVVGALKVLTRPETWHGTKVDIERGMLGGQGILGLSDRCIGSVDCNLVSFQGFDGYLGHVNTPGNGWIPDQCNSCGSRQRLIVGFRQLSAGIADMCFRFRSLATNSIVGPHVCELRAMQVDSTIGNVWQLAYDDCVLGDQFVSGVGTVFSRSSFDAKRIGLSSLAAFMFVISLSGGIVCEPA